MAWISAQFTVYYSSLDAFTEPMNLEFGISWPQHQLRLVDRVCLHHRTLRLYTGTGGENLRPLEFDGSVLPLSSQLLKSSMFVLHGDHTH